MNQEGGERGEGARPKFAQDCPLRVAIRPLELKFPRGGRLERSRDRQPVRVRGLPF